MGTLKPLLPLGERNGPGAGGRLTADRGRGQGGRSHRPRGRARGPGGRAPRSRAGSQPRVRVGDVLLGAGRSGGPARRHRRLLRAAGRLPARDPPALAPAAGRFAAGNAGVVYPTCSRPPGPPAPALRPVHPAAAGRRARGQPAGLPRRPRRRRGRGRRARPHRAHGHGHPGATTARLRSSPRPSTRPARRAPSPRSPAEDALFLLAAAGTPAEHRAALPHRGRGRGQRWPRLSKPHLPAWTWPWCAPAACFTTSPDSSPTTPRWRPRLLTDLGLPRLGAVVGEHMVIDPRLPGARRASPRPNWSTWRTRPSPRARSVGLDERLARTVRKMRPSPETAQTDRRAHHRRPD